MPTDFLSSTSVEEPSSCSFPISFPNTIFDTLHSSSLTNSCSSSSPSSPCSTSAIPASVSEFPPESSPISLRKSNRTSKPPTYLQDYHCQLAITDAVSQATSSSHAGSSLPSTSGIPYALSSSLSYSQLSPSHRQFALALTTISEPTSFA